MFLFTLVALSIAASPPQSSATITIGKSSADSAEQARKRAKRDTIAARNDSLRAIRDSTAAQRRLEKKIPLTPQLLASAFRDSMARTLLTRARVTRLAQDSSLTSYDATTYERLSVDLQIGRLGRERTVFRSERASRVQWERNKGAVVDITGARTALPVVGSGNADFDIDNDIPIPYFPGRDALWGGSGIAKANVTDDDIINPLANGAEAYYTYATGDSLSFQVTRGSRIVVRELLVRPRRPRWNVVVGSLWFDVASGQLVRAVYRLSEPIDILAEDKEEGGGDSDDDIPLLLRPFLTPLVASLDVITVDYGLFEGRFWLPRLQIIEGKGNAGALHIPVALQQRFEYSSVNGTLDLPAVQLTETDTAHGPDAYRIRREARAEECKDTSASRIRRRTRYDKTLNVLVRTPCDTAALARSPTLPPSIYSTTDTLFNQSEIDAMINDALTLRHQGEFVPQRPVVHYGIRYTTYNRIEGLATGAEVQQTFGNGYTGRALLRFGSADLRPKGELSLSRSNGRQTLTAAAYTRLVAANDWGNFFSLSSSLSALLLGRDEGMYYRSWGAELRYEQRGGFIDSWRLFAEEHSDARMHSTFSVMHAIRDSHNFRDNIDATNGSILGLSFRKLNTFGQDPRRPRLTSDLRFESAVGSFDYVRGMADVTLSSPLTRSVDAALTLSGGTSGGHLPVQRLWFLGGTYTVRGQPMAAAAGNAYWLTRLEFGFGGLPLFRPTLFGDLGWAGDRSQFRENVRPISGGGVGFSILDGLIRLDVAKGIRPKRSIRGNLYLDARF